VADLLHAHGLEPVDARREPQEGRRVTGRLVLPDVHGLEASGGVHGSEPTGDEAQRPEEAPDGTHRQLTGTPRPRVQLAEHVGHERAVMPLRLLDPVDLGALVLPPQRPPVRPVGVRGRQLTGVGVLEDPDQLLANGGVRGHPSIEHLRRRRCAVAPMSSGALRRHLSLEGAFADVRGQRGTP
jgi:hypothetical protein